MHRGMFKISFMSTKTRIIYYSPHPHLNLMSPSGFGTHMREMITAFEDEGCEVLPVIMGGIDNPPEVKDDSQESNAKSFFKKVLSKNIWRSLKDFNLLRFDKKAARRLEESILKFRPDMIYERCNYMQLSGIRMAQKHSVFHAMELNSPYIEQQRFLSKSYSFLESYAGNIEQKQLKGTDLPLAVVGPLKEYFSNKYSVDPDKFLVTHDAFNKDNILLNKDRQKEIINHYGLSNKTIIGFVGSIFEWHGLDKLIKAFQKLPYNNVKLLIVGYGSYMNELIELVEALGLEEEVIFTGGVPKNQVFNYISLMDICTAPDAAWYQSPVKIFEYGAMGKPIIAPDTEAVREIMDQEEDGILTDATVEGLREGLVHLLENRKKALVMGKKFQKKVLNDYTWKKNARKVLAAKERMQYQ